MLTALLIMNLGLFLLGVHIIARVSKVVRRADAQAAEIRKFTTTIKGLMATSEGASCENADRVLAALRGER